MFILIVKNEIFCCVNSIILTIKYLKYSWDILIKPKPKKYVFTTIEQNLYMRYNIYNHLKNRQKAR